MFVYLVAVLSVIVYFWLKWNYTYWKRLGVPGPEPWFFIGNIGAVLTMSKHFAIMYQEWYKKFHSAPYIGFYKIFNPAIMLRDPELIKDVLIKNFHHFEANDFAFDEKLDPLLAHNPFLVSDERWKESRNLLTPLFTVSKTKYFLPLMMPTCDKLSAYIKEKGASFNHDAKDLAAKYTTENVARVAFSVDADCFQDPKCEFREMGKKMFKPSLMVSIKMTFTLFCPMMLKLIPIPFLPREVEIWMRNLVTTNIKSRQNVKMPHDDLLQMLINLRQQNKSVTDEQLAGHSLAFFTEAFETSSSLLSFALYQLALNQDMQERLRREINEEISKCGDEFSFEALTAMSYLDAVMHETLRLHTPVMGMSKICTKDFSMPAGPSNVTIKRGTTVIIPVYALHMDAHYYPDPEKFDPARFTGENDRPKCVFLPFGEGPRMCMGVRFAMVQTKAAMVTIIRNFKVTLSADHKPFVLDNTSFIQLAKDGILLNFKPLY
jgi:cytochrome P450